MPLPDGKGILRAIAVDGGLNELARADLPVVITPPVVTFTIDDPPGGASIGIDEPFDADGSVSWTPAVPGFVDSVRVKLLRSPSGEVIDEGIATITGDGAGTRDWTRTLVGDQPIPAALIRATAFDATGKDLGHTDVSVTIPADGNRRDLQPTRLTGRIVRREHSDTRHREHHLDDHQPELY